MTDPYREPAPAPAADPCKRPVIVGDGDLLLAGARCKPPGALRRWVSTRYTRGTRWRCKRCGRVWKLAFASHYDTLGDWEEE